MRVRGINWAVVRRYARLGADRDTIVTALAIDPDTLRRPEVLERLQGEMARGAALHELDLLQDVKRLREGGPGKVNAVLASLRQKLKWNRPSERGGEDAKRPDAGAAVAEITRMLGRFRAPR